MNIKYKDIDAISYALCYANAMLDFKIEELEQKGFNNAVAGYRAKKEEIKEGIDALQKIRKELHLKDDYAYNEVFGVFNV
ncbi:hypothetical protein [Parabacteroides chinchillae]|uniref:Uncharacterized protein n=1 Tax=Parabacteroides chinchillae TaxID=871327 RepID=A0A8G2BWE3_9BACT|nr:hypothetical protein [Parabacteroides chinchillae]SEF86636.1 hypothetical protein SAMN05444001_108127 [Parabacteroides chinchillae]